MKNSNSYSSLALALVVASSGLSAEENNFNFSGFGQIVLGKVTTDKAEFNDYDSSFQFKPESLIGLQLDYDFSEKVSVSSQLIGYTNSDKKSGIKWLSLNYQPNKNLLFKIGKLKVPFFNYSDVSTVGFSYPWITLPTQVYNEYMFDDFEGVFVRYDIPNKMFALNIEGYWGSKNGAYYIGEDRIEADVNDLRGIIANVSRDGLSFRVSSHTGYSQSGDKRIETFSNQLADLGFQESADSLSVIGDVNFYQASVNYDNVDYFVRTEWSKIAPSEMAVPSIESAYLTLGYNLYPFTFHTTIAKSDVEYRDRADDIPFGVAPALDQLYYAYNFIYDTLPRDELNSFSVGMRWDWKTNIAFKADVTSLKGVDNKRSFYSIIDEPFDRKAILFQLAITWVF